MIKILHLAHAFYPDRSGTSERIFYSQPRDGFKHYIIKPGNENSFYEHQGFIIHTIKLNVKKKSLYRTYKNAKLISDYAQNLIVEHNIDILYGHNPVLFSLATLITCNNVSIKLIYEPHNLLFSQYLNQLNKKRRTYIPYILKHFYYSYLTEIENRLFKKSSIIISQTKALKNQISKIYSIDADKIIVGYNGMPEHEISLSYSQILSKFRLKKNKYIIYGGDLSDNNGLAEIIKLIKSCKNYFFIIAGSGKYHKILKSYSKKYTNLFFYGELSKADYLELLSISEVLLILRKSDLTNNIYLPLKILDAILFEKKVITTNLSIMKEVSNFYLNLYYVDFDFKNLENKIFEVINTNNKISLISKENKSTFSWSVTRKNISKVIRKTIVN